MSDRARCSRLTLGTIASGFLIVVGVLAWVSSPGGLTGAEPRSPDAGPPGVILTKPEMSSEISGSLRAVHEKLWIGIRPEENAAVWLMPIYGDESLDEVLHDATLEILGIKSLPSSSPYFVPIGDFVEHLDDVKPEEVGQKSAELEEALMYAGRQLWDRENSQHLQGYLNANEKALDTLKEASRQPHYFAPLLAPELPSRLMGASLVIERRLPFLVRMLVARAMMRFDTGDFDGCLSDLTAGHRIASLLANGSPFDVSVAKAQVIDMVTFLGEKALLESGKLTETQLQSLLKELTALPAFPPIAQAADVGERAIIHQEIELLKSDEDSRIGFFETDDKPPENRDQVKSLLSCNWKLAHEAADQAQDQVVKALSTRDRVEQEKLFVELDRAAAEFAGTEGEKSNQFSEELKKDPSAISKWVGLSMAYSLRPIYRQRRYAEDRQISRRHQLVIACALEEAKRKDGKFPDQLKDLVPTYLKHVPNDVCTDAPFLYRRLSDHEASLTSLGTNQRDDAGMNFNDDLTLQLK